MSNSVLASLRGIPRKIWVPVILAVLFALLMIKSNSIILADDMTYRVMSGRTIALTVGAPNLSWTRVTGVTETATEVRIAVETLVYPIPLPQSASLPFQYLTVTLSSDLGDRFVEDARGAPIPPSP